MRKKLIIFALLFLSILFPMSSTNAKMQKKVLITLEETTNLSVSLNYDKEEPKVYFVSPSGDKYTEKNAKERNMQIERGDKFITFYIRNASAGEWKIVYDKGKNKELEVNCAPFADMLTIKSLSAKKEGNNSLKIDFKCSYTEDTYYNYEIFAVTKENGKVSGTKSLGSGSATANQKQTTEVSLNELSSYDSYYIRLQVRMDANGVEIWDEKVTDKPFSYTNPQTPNEIKNCIFTVDVLNSRLLCEWDNSEVNAEEYILAIYKEDEKDTVCNQVVEGNEDNHTAAFQIDMEWKSLRAEIAYRAGGVTSKIYEVKIPLKSNDYKVAMETEEFTNARQLRVSYHVPKKTQFVVKIGEHEEKTMVEGNDIVSYNLPDYSNECELTYEVSEHLQYLLKKTITVDTVAPTFKLYENYSSISTTRSDFDIVGTTEKNTKLYVNGTEYAIDDIGAFSIPVSLSFGENAFEIKVMDEAGNAAQQTVIITRTSKSSILKSLNFENFQKWIPLLCSFLVSSILCLFWIMLYGYRRRKRPEAPQRNLRIIHCMINVTLLLFVIAAEALMVYKTVFYYWTINQHSYYDLVKNSIEQAYNSKVMMLEYATATGIGVLIIILLSLLLKRHVHFLHNHLDDQKHEKKKRKRVKQKVEQGGKFCKNCGAKIAIGDSFCDKCGKKQE